MLCWRSWKIFDKVDYHQHVVWVNIFIVLPFENYVAQKNTQYHIYKPCVAQLTPTSQQSSHRRTRWAWIRRWGAHRSSGFSGRETTQINSASCWLTNQFRFNWLSFSDIGTIPVASASCWPASCAQFWSTFVRQTDFSRKCTILEIKRPKIVYNLQNFQTESDKITPKKN